jgi:hypothetical protein
MPGRGGEGVPRALRVARFLSVSAFTIAYMRRIKRRNTFGQT